MAAIGDLRVRLFLPHRHPARSHYGGGCVGIDFVSSDLISIVRPCGEAEDVGLRGGDSIVIFVYWGRLLGFSQFQCVFVYLCSSCCRPGNPLGGLG